MRDKPELLVSEAYLRAILSYIKPGTIHRYSSHKELLHLISIPNIVLQYLDKIKEEILQYKRGVIGLSDLRIGETILNVSRNYLEWVRYENELVSPLIISALSNTYSVLIDPGNTKGVHKKVIESINGEQTAMILEAMRITGGKQHVEYLIEKGLSVHFVKRENISLQEVLHELERTHLIFKGVIDNTMIGKISNVIYQENLNGTNLNSSIIKGFLEYLTNTIEQPYQGEIKKAIENKGMETGKGIKILYDLDQEMRRRKKKTDYALPLLFNATLHAMLKGSMPP